MRHLTFLLVLTFFSVFAGFAQSGSIKGTVIDGKTVLPVENISVQVEGTEANTYSNAEGEFLLNNVPAGNGILIFSGEGFETKQLEFALADGQLLKIGTVKLVIASEFSTETIEMPVIELDAPELDSEDGDESQSVGGLLHSSGDVFSSVAAYTFGAVRFRTRGYDSENSAIYFNGIEMNNLETGRPYYSDWGGLNEVVRNKELYFGQDNNDVTLSYIGGGANVLTKASEYRPGVNVSYMSRLANYKNRVMATYSSGLLDNGWAFTLSGSKRWAEEGYVEGTFYDAYSAFAAIEKVIDKHSISLTAFVTPNKRGKQIGAPQELYDLEDNVFYNANWGYQNGEKRNSRVANSFKPYIMLNHIWDINDKMKLNSTVSYSFGRNGNTALTWGDAKDPRPTYYRYLPSYNSDNPEYAWVNNQVDWDALYQANSDEFFYVEDANGVPGNNIVGEKRSKYMIEDRRIDHSQISANINFKYELNEDLKFTAVANYSNYKGRHFKLVDDLLGGDFWYDINKFALGDKDNPDALQSDLNNPNHVAREGDAFGYDYDANIQKIGGFIKADYSSQNTDAYIAVGVSNTSFFRTGNMKVGSFPDNSYGDSEKQNFFNYNINAGLTYKITGRHIVYANGSYMTRAPYFDESYISPRTRDNVVEGLTSEKIMSFDVNYLARLPYLTGRVSAYYTTFQDQTDVLSFYHDDYKDFVNYAMTGIDKQHFGMELGLEGKITSELSLKGAAALGQHTYTSRPNVSATIDNTAKTPIGFEEESQVVYVKDYRVDGSPQSAYSLGLNYRSPKFWWVEANVNYFDNTYLSFNPARRTTDAVQGVDLSSQLAEDILAQEKLPSALTFNLSGGASWYLGDYYLRIFATVNNVLDNKEVITGGYEQLRFDYADKDVDKFSPVYYYMYGRTYMVIVTLSF